MQIQNSFELLSYLKTLDLLDQSPSWWWPNYGSFEVVVGAILTQNTRWENVQKSLQNLHSSKILQNQNEEDLISLCRSDDKILASLIAPSGFANQKSKRLILLATNILEEFGNFESFVNNVSAEWLIAQKGIGAESRDCILNYACLREVMVVDRYTQRLLASLGYEMFTYDEIQNWLMSGLEWGDLNTLYPKEVSLAQIYARYHGKIVELGKRGAKDLKDLR
ncbi:3-methyladenine DNA glycosylase [Helicobacter cholecystus]|uniref:3-methyladenine DNA glycosylase n=1 Tax=Helicobacter cholecystus TaxID=45498 RepID=UPI003F756B41